MTLPSSGLHSLDRTIDPAERLRFLDCESAKPAMQYARRRSIELLEIRPGARILDVGCGAGDDARAMAALVGRNGRVDAIDVDPQMLAEAARRSNGVDLPVDFRLADVYSLAESDATFDGSRAERVFLHLAEPERALAQMVRVVKRDGKVVVLERDIETRTIDVPAADRAVTRRIINFWCDRFLGGWIGRQLPRLFAEAGLREVAIEPVTVIDTDFAAFDAQYDLTRIVGRAEAAGAITFEESTQWLRQLDEVVRAGSFFSSMTNFIVSGRKA
ncbi:MAG TPA: methyltransferase domain-containing protein [Vicinamibacterales bacterium]|jgi:SAM-dependent methyltransferase|nr:methyltransferase domain-containing protein [Vicinamibacterales bacterium]